METTPQCLIHPVTIILCIPMEQMLKERVVASTHNDKVRIIEDTSCEFRSHWELVCSIGRNSFEVHPDEAQTLIALIESVKPYFDEYDGNVYSETENANLLMSLPEWDQYRTTIASAFDSLYCIDEISIGDETEWVMGCNDPNDTVLFSPGHMDRAIDLYFEFYQTYVDDDNVSIRPLETYDPTENVTLYF